MAAFDKDAVWIRAGWLIDGTGSTARPDVFLRIEKGIIVTVEKALPPAMPFTDLSHCTLLPPLVDCHVHLFISGTPDPEARKLQLRNQFSEASKIIADHLRHHMRHGVLAVRDGGDHGGYVLRYRETCPNPDALVRVKAAGRAWHARGRYGSLIGRPPRDGEPLARSIEEDASRQNAALPIGDTASLAPAARPLADHVKIVNSGLNSLVRFGLETPPQFALDELQDAVKAANRLGLNTMIHANGRLPVRYSVLSGCNSVEHGFFMGSENLKALAARPVTWVPTACTMKAYAESLESGTRRCDTARRTLDHQLEQLALARELGVPAATGTDSGSPGVHHGAAIKEEIRLFVQAGYSLAEALRCATWNGARLLGLDNELGALLPGMPATFLAVRAAPAQLPDHLDRIEAIYVRGLESVCALL